MHVKGGVSAGFNDTLKPYGNWASLKMNLVLTSAVSLLIPSAGPRAVPSLAYMTSCCPTLHVSRRLRKKSSDRAKLLDSASMRQVPPGCSHKKNHKKLPNFFFFFFLISYLRVRSTKFPKWGQKTKTRCFLTSSAS